jgi:amino acid transporter
VAAITAKRVRNPRLNVGRASVLGTAASAILYLVVAAAVMGLVPNGTLRNSTAPFVPAFEAIFSHGAWAGKLVAALAVVSGIGALNGWTLVTAEVSRAPASDGSVPEGVRLDRPQGHGLVRHRDGGGPALAADQRWDSSVRSSCTGRARSCPGSPRRTSAACCSTT